MKVEDLTIGQYYKFEEFVKDNDVFGIFDLFGVDISDMSVQEMNRKFAEITNLSFTNSKLNKEYMIGNIKYKAQLNLTKIKAGQFIDFQAYMAGDKKIEQILSIFLIPMKKTWFGWKEQKYGDYDVFLTQQHIKDNFRIVDAKTLSDFFLNLSVKLLQIMKDSSMREIAKKAKNQK
jgi:hypothetical protein